VITGEGYTSSYLRFSVPDQKDQNQENKMQKEGKQFQTQIGDHVLTFETGKLAGLAGGALTLRVGDVMVFSTATMSSKIRQGIDFLPLSVDYEERMYAGGAYQVRSFVGKDVQERMRSSLPVLQIDHCDLSSQKIYATISR